MKKKKKPPKAELGFTAPTVARVAIVLKGLPEYQDTKLEYLIPVAHNLLLMCQAQLDKDE